MKIVFRALGISFAVFVIPTAVFAQVCTAGSAAGGTFQDGTCKAFCDTASGEKLITGATGCDTSPLSSAPTCCSAPTAAPTSPAPTASSPSSPALSCADACSGGTLRTSCQTGEFQSFYCSDSHEWCCAATAPAAAAQNAGTSSTQAIQTGALTFGVPQKCLQTGNCSLDDILTTGTSFANFITGLSAALFFATFVYGGARYLLSFGEAKNVEAGKKAMTGAAYGMAIILFAWTLLNYLVNAITGKL